MNIKTLAFVLLTERLISAGFIVAVLKRQLSLFRLNLDDDLHGFRLVLFCLSGAIFVGNFIPIVIDVLTLAADLKGRTTSPSPIGVAYAASNATTAVISSVFVWALYRIAARTLANTRKK